jgi:hypothetical protein
MHRWCSFGSAGRPLFQFGKNSDATMRYAGVATPQQPAGSRSRFSGGFMVTTAIPTPRPGFNSESGGLWNYIQQDRNYARLDFDREHAFVQSYLYELPFGKNKPFLKEGAGRWILGDWQLNGIFTLMSGRPLTFGTNVNANTPGSSITPDQVAEINVTHSVAGPGGSVTWFDPSAFRQPLDADGRTPHFGSMGRNNFSGPGLGNLDLSLFRKFQITERFKGEFRFETLNLTNTPLSAIPTSR